MRALYLTSSGLEFRPNYPQPSAGVGEALIRVHLAGVCSTDLELVKGYFGFTGVPGHEFVGTVEAAADQRWVGQRVVSSINFVEESAAGFAKYGREHHPQRRVLGILQHDGAMADYVVVPQANLFTVPEGVSDEAVVFTEPLAAALRIAQQMPVRPDSRIAVVGPGRLGMLIARVLMLGGSDLLVLGRSETSLALAREWDLQTALVDEASSSTFDMVVEATGNAAGLAHALRLIRPQGTLVMKSTYAAAPEIDLTKIVVDEISVQGSRCGPFPPALRLLQRGAIDTESLIDARYPLESGLQAFEHAAQAGVRKVLLAML